MSAAFTLGRSAFLPGHSPLGFRDLFVCFCWKPLENVPLTIRKPFISEELLPLQSLLDLFSSLWSVELRGGQTFCLVGHSGSKNDQRRSSRMKGFIGEKSICRKYVQFYQLQ